MRSEHHDLIPYSHLVSCLTLPCKDSSIHPFHVAKCVTFVASIDDYPIGKIPNLYSLLHTSNFWLLLSSYYMTQYLFNRIHSVYPFLLVLHCCKFVSVRRPAYVRWALMSSDSEPVNMSALAATYMPKASTFLVQLMPSYWLIAIQQCVSNSVSVIVQEQSSEVSIVIATHHHTVVWHCQKHSPYCHYTLPYYVAIHDSFLKINSILCSIWFKVYVWVEFIGVRLHGRVIKVFQSALTIREKHGQGHSLSPHFLHSIWTCCYMLSTQQICFVFQSSKTTHEHCSLVGMGIDFLEYCSNIAVDTSLDHSNHCEMPLCSDSQLETSFLRSLSKSLRTWFVGWFIVNVDFSGCWLVDCGPSLLDFTRQASSRAFFRLSFPLSW